MRSASLSQKKKKKRGSVGLQPPTSFTLIIQIQRTAFTDCPCYLVCHIKQTASMGKSVYMSTRLPYNTDSCSNTDRVSAGFTHMPRMYHVNCETAPAFVMHNVSVYIRTRAAHLPCLLLNRIRLAVCAERYSKGITPEIA